MQSEWKAYKARHKLQDTNITIITGGARGADELAERLAKETDTRLQVMKADWKAHGKAAGPIRNAAMAKAAGADGRLLAYWDGKSPGTADMIKQAKRAGLKVQTVDLAPADWEQCRLE